MIQNPVLKGFNPDPSILRVGNDYYLATSTFEWFPGVQIHHSVDLINWTLVARPLRRQSQLDLRGVPDSCGVWAPCLTYVNGQFHLVYTSVLRYGQATVSGANSLALRDFKNFLVTCPTIDGDWSDPVFLNSSGFDPSLFQDDDGKTYLLNMLWDHRVGQQNFAGIILQAYCTTRAMLIGERQLIFKGTSLGFTEGPHLFKRNGWYYLLVAEGGTSWDHAVVVARSRQLSGPYEPSPLGPLITSRGRPDLPLQRAGHGDLVETPDGDWFIAYLCGRPLPGQHRCVMGRETAVQQVRWTGDDWLATLSGEPFPELNVDWGNAKRVTAPSSEIVYDFDAPDLPLDFQWLRTPLPERLFSLTARPGYLRLYGRETVGSQFEQSLVARRLESFGCRITTRLDFTPRNFQQSAGLIAYYNSSKFHYFYVTVDDVNGRHLRVLSVLPDDEMTVVLSQIYPLEACAIELRLDIDHDALRFAFRSDGTKDWTWLSERFDMSFLADEAVRTGEASFTGTLLGMACQDMAGEAITADFNWFTYVDT